MILKIILIAACWTHAAFHDIVSGYVGFLSMVAVALISFNKRKRKRTFIQIMVNVAVVISAIAFFVAMKKYEV
jgi:hypothetical protein